MISVTQGKNERTLVLKAPRNAALFDLAREMPGRKKWQDDLLYFEATRANVEYVQKHWPTATWDTPRLEAVINIQQAEEAALAARAAPRVLPPEATHFRFKTSPMDHQREAFAKLRGLAFFALFLEQGLGKTKVCLDIAAYKWSEGEIDTLLVMAPNGVQTQWASAQLEDHLPDWVPRSAVVYSGNRTKKQQAAEEAVFAYDRGLRIFCINQEAVITKNGEAFISRVLRSGKAMWAIDESPSIKTPGSKRTKAVLKFGKLARVRCILTGTPVGRGIEDLYSQLMFLHQDILGFSSFYTFRNHFCEVRQVYGAPQGVVEIVSYRNVDELKRKLAVYSVRYTAAECLNLPERIYTRREVPWHDDQKRMYNQLLEEAITQVSTGEIVTADQAIVMLMRLQQLACGFIRDENGVYHDVPNYRLATARAFIEQADDKVILWARFQNDIDRLRHEFRDLNPVVWDGRTPIDEKLWAKDQFINNPKCGAFIGNQAAAGTGLDGLQHASHTMLYYSNSFKPTDRWQSEARLFRMGQKGTVIVGDLEIKNSIDTRLLSVLSQREETARKTIDEQWQQPAKQGEEPTAITFLKELAA